MSGPGRRRSQGEGSVFRRSDGLWRGVLDLGWVDGKRVRRWVSAPTERQVLAKLAELKEAQRRGLNLAARPRTFGDWLDEWIAMKERQGTRATTLLGYRWLIRDHVKRALGGKRLDKLTPTAVRRLVKAKSASSLSGQSVRLMHGLIRNALADAEREELVYRNVAKLVRPPSVRREEVRVLTVEEARRLVASIKGDRLEALWLCAPSLLACGRASCLACAGTTSTLKPGLSPCAKRSNGSTAAWSSSSRRLRCRAGRSRYPRTRWQF